MARASGLSRSTVSRVFTDAENVSPHAQIKVREAARALGYSPNLVASALAGRRHRHLGLLIRDATNPAYGQLHAEMSMAVDEVGHALVSATARRHEYGNAELQGLQHLIGLQVAGLFVSTGVTPPDDLVAACATVPMMIIGRPNTDPRINSVSYDEERHGRMMAAHLAERGHRRIAVLSAPELYSRVFRLRVEAVLDEFAHRGLEAIEVDLLPVEEGTERALDAAAEQSLSCIVCPVDYVALDLLRAARRRGVRVPEDVSVVGFDGLADGLDLLGLTTLRLPVREMSRTAVDHMMGMLEQTASRGPGTASGQRVEHLLVAGDLIDGTTLSAL